MLIEMCRPKGQGRALPQNQGDDGVCLCQDCVDRVARAIDADTARLEEERLAYGLAVSAEKERLDSLVTTLRATHWSPDASQFESDDLITRTEESFREEIAVLAATCKQHEQELHQLQNLFKEQALLSQELDKVDDYLEEERNRLQIEAHAFGHVQYQLTRSLRDAQREIEALSTVSLHSALFHLVVDKRGIRYPLINDLRLAFRPKGDVQWTEISAAWSQAAQLLLLVAASVKFRSKDWRIVPLTSCAKLIHLDGKHRAVYTLGGNDNPESQHPTKMCMSLRAMNALLDQLCRHVSTLQQTGTHPLPYETTRNRIGRFELSHLDDGNDSGWSSVIHCMASNLQWLSDRASVYEIKNVTDTI